MIFSTQQIKMTYNFMALADEATLQSVLAVLSTGQLKKIFKTVERSIRNRIPNTDCVCSHCHMHAVNSEDGVEVCDSCLAE